MLAKTKLNRFKTATFSIILILISCGIGLAITELTLSAYNKQIRHSDQMERGLVGYDNNLGWRLTPGWSGKHTHHDFSVSYQINNLGLRSPWLTGNPAKGTTLVLGDSFTFGIGVNNGETFVDILNTLKTPNGHFINAGVPGYSTDQELLALEQWLPVFKPKQTLLVIYPGNDILDNPLPYPLQSNHAKPYFKLENGQLIRPNNNVPTTPKPPAKYSISLTDIAFGQPMSPWYRATSLGRLLPERAPFNEKLSSLLQKQNLDSLALFDQILYNINGLIKKSGGKLSLVLLPDSNYFANTSSYTHHYQTYFMGHIEQIAHSLGIPVINFGDASSAHIESRTWYHPHEGHLSANGHSALAHYIAERLIQQPPH